MKTNEILHQVTVAGVHYVEAIAGAPVDRLMIDCWRMCIESGLRVITQHNGMVITFDPAANQICMPDRIPVKNPVKRQR